MPASPRPLQGLSWVINIQKKARRRARVWYGALTGTLADAGGCNGRHCNEKGSPAGTGEPFEANPD